MSVGPRLRDVSFVLQNGHSQCGSHVRYVPITEFVIRSLFFLCGAGRMRAGRHVS
jgi:hypothetical protein